MLKNYDIAILGAGPAGIMAGLSARKIDKNAKICIVDSNNNIASKLRLTGGGRCNFTNNKDISVFFDNVVRNSKFLYSALYSFSNEDLKTFIKASGLEYIVEDDNDDKVYLKSGKSMDLIEVLNLQLRNSGIDFIGKTKIKELDLKSRKIFSDDLIIEANTIIIASGACSYPQTGSDGSIMKLLSNKGYNIIKPVSALAPMDIKESWVKDIPGISLQNIQIKVLKLGVKNKSGVKSNSQNVKHKKVAELFGDIVFTHKGIGGPAALKASSYINRDISGSSLELDFIPYINREALLDMVKSNPKKTIPSNLKELFPNNFLKRILEKCNDESEGQFDFLNDYSANLSNKNFEILYESLKGAKITPTALADLERATITSGGIDVKNINSSTLESNIDPNIYFAGELIDIDALTGGYNLQIAFSTGYLAGVSAAENLKNS
ncbi:MAG: aminoacetone oxidase family FAD-binding enzyme [Peptostreptococcus sp.]|uniref:NAD(P)/FAD-dependent oxidoreductase n=1 Tax=Peptostreptococcus sp. TaxID=1262 RepID=UPI002FCA0176